MPKMCIRGLIIMAMVVCAVMAGKCNCSSNNLTTDKNKETKVVLKFARAPLIKQLPEFKILPDEEILARYKEYYRKLNLNTGVLEEQAKLEGEPKLFPPEYNKRENSMIFHICGPVSMEIDGTDGRLLRVFNNTLSNWEGEAMFADPVKFAKRAKPARNKNDILQLAKKYRQLAMGDFPKGITYTEPAVEFDDNTNLVIGNTQIFKGTWEVTWQRLLNGYKVWGSCISISIDDELGELYNFNNDRLYPPCPTDVKISQKEAEDIAWATLAHLEENNAYLKGFKINHIVRSELLIVHSEYYLDPEIKKEDFGRIDCRQTRLAYRIYFAREGYDTALTDIAIDAATGEVIDASLPL